MLKEEYLRNEGKEAHNDQVHVLLGGRPVEWIFRAVGTIPIDNVVIRVRLMRREALLAAFVCIRAADIWCSHYEYSIRISVMLFLLRSRMLDLYTWCQGMKIG